MKKRALSILLLLALVVAGCALPDPEPKPTIDLSAYKDDIQGVTLSFCDSAEVTPLINLAATDYIINLADFKPSCELEPASDELEGLLAAFPGIQYDLSNVRLTFVDVIGDRDPNDYFYPEGTSSTEFSLLYVEGSGYMRYSGVSNIGSEDVEVYINVSLSPGYTAIAFEENMNPPSAKIYQVPVSSLEWESVL